MLTYVQTWASGGVTSKVSQVIVNPAYSGNNNDIAILKLSTSIPTSSTISYISLPASGSDPASGSSSTVAGWYVLPLSPQPLKPRLTHHAGEPPAPAALPFPLLSATSPSRSSPALPASRSTAPPPSPPT